MASTHEIGRPREPIDRLVEPLARFLHVEAAGGMVLLSATAAALLLANSPAADAFLGFWRTELVVGLGGLELRHTLRHWINDGLMAVFFFVMGLEVKRELAIGELSELRRALFPLAGAVGGMLVPAGLYLALQAGEPGARGWGIPMATDIAFVVGCLAVLGPRVPASLRVFVVSLAIADDVGAILVIAVGYAEDLALGVLALGVLGIGAVSLLARLGMRSLTVYGLLGFAIWLAFHESGVHATVAGVVLGLMTPARPYLQDTVLGQALERVGELFRGGAAGPAARLHAVQDLRRTARETVSPLTYLEALLHPWVAFGILPLFALANAGVAVRLEALTDPVALAVALGLVVGKPAGILGFASLAAASGLARRPSGLGWAHLAGASSLAGIGFTMSLFIAGLALEGPTLDAAKLGVLGASVVAALLGMGLLFALAGGAGPAARPPGAGGAGEIRPR